MHKSNLFSSSLLAVAGVFSLAACSQQSAGPVSAPPPAAVPETIAIAVGPCFGFCPVYDVRVAPAGSVTFEGQRHTAVLGVKERQAGEKTYRALAEALAPFRPAHGTTARVECDAAISDTSSYTITWTDTAGRTTTATHQRGCSGGPGQALDGVLKNLPERLGIEGWAAQVTRPGTSRG